MIQIGTFLIVIIVLVGNQLSVTARDVADAVTRPTIYATNGDGKVLFGNDDNDAQSDNWRDNVMMVGCMGLGVAALVAIGYCCCRGCVGPPEEAVNADVTSEGLLRRGTSNGNERFPRDSFYNPPPRYSFLIRSHSQRRARLSVLRKRREEEELPRYSAAVRQLSQDALDRAEYAATVSPDNGLSSCVIGIGDLGATNRPTSTTSDRHDVNLDGSMNSAVNCHDARVPRNAADSTTGPPHGDAAIDLGAEVLPPSDQNEIPQALQGALLTVRGLLGPGEDPPRYSAIITTGGNESQAPIPPRYSDIVQDPKKPIPQS